MEQHDRARGQESQQIELWESGPSIHESANDNFAGIILPRQPNAFNGMKTQSARL
jgi:hypothetical protein